MIYALDLGFASCPLEPMRSFRLFPALPLVRRSQHLPPVTHSLRQQFAPRPHATHLLRVTDSRVYSSDSASTSAPSTVSNDKPSYPFGIYSYVVRVKYDGTAMYGMQSQGPGTLPTVQDAVERSIQRVFKIENARTLGLACSGRTDAGVHSRDQHIQFFVGQPWQGFPIVSKSSDSAKSLVLAINSSLPPDIRVFEARQVPPDFHVRYDAQEKTYHYSINTSHVLDPFVRNYRMHYAKTDVDWALAAEGFRRFEGLHHFAAFSSKSPDGVTRDPMRVMTRCQVVPIEDGLRFEVTGTGFLYRQVRHMVGAALSYGRRRVSPERLTELLAGPQPDGPASLSRANEWQVAPPQGLMLERVFYVDGHDDPTVLYHPELPHRADGRVDGRAVLEDEDLGRMIQEIRNRALGRMSVDGVE